MKHSHFLVKGQELSQIEVTPSNFIVAALEVGITVVEEPGQMNMVPMICVEWEDRLVFFNPYNLVSYTMEKE